MCLKVSGWYMNDEKTTVFFENISLFFGKSRPGVEKRFVRLKKLSIRSERCKNGFRPLVAVYVFFLLIIGKV